MLNLLQEGGESPGDSLYIRKEGTEKIKIPEKERWVVTQ